jgi:hypothetical protein
MRPAAARSIAVKLADGLRAAAGAPGAGPWAPLPGPQTAALESEADELLYGGAAGGGKTDLLLGAALGHRRAIIFRRVYPSLSAIVERSKEVYEHLGELNEAKFKWKLKGPRLVRFGSVQHEKNKRDYQGQAHDFYGFDEITEFSESIYRFVIGWNRTAARGQRCRVICTGNPPTSAEGEWVIRHWGPWLDPGHPNPAEPGELRWFTNIDGQDVELPGAAPFRGSAGRTVLPTSRTFIPAKVADNPYLVDSGYVARLEALPEPLRSKLLYGDFTKGREDSPFQVIPAEWVGAAQDRWRAAPRPDGPMTAMGVDVARGGADRTVIAMRYGAWLDQLRAYPGAATPDGPAVAALVMAQRRDNAAINVDVIGVGSSVYDHLKGLGADATAVNGAERSDATDKSGQMRFVNRRAEIYWKLREALDPAGGEGLCLPPDKELAADLCAPTWKLTVRGVQVESKGDLAKRLGRSPDKGDAAVYAFALITKKGAGIFDWVKRMATGGGE